MTPLAAAAALALLCVAARASAPAGDAPRLAPRDPSLAEELVDKTLSYPLARWFDAPHTVRRLAGRPYEAVGVDAFDDVPSSTWFTHRNGRRQLSRAQILTGAGGAGPDTAGAWRVIAFKSAGVTPGMTIVDGHGHRYLIKFDPPAFEGLPSGAEVVASRLLHAAGYNVPQNHVVWVDPGRLVCATEAVHEVGTTDSREPLRQAPLGDPRLVELLQRANPRDKARVRALASRFLSGRILGPFPYVGTRRGDPDDRIPHEHRRELRGLYVVASWINHADMKEENTLDVFDPDRGAVVHYLIDFGASLGSNSRGPSNPRRGKAHSFDLVHAFVRLATAGLYVFDYERAPRAVAHSAVGYLDNSLFDPGGWKPMYPAPPFDLRTDRDGFWGARLVTSFSDGQIAAAVEAAHYPAAAAQVMVRYLVERRDRIGRYWFARLAPLDGFAASGDELRFTDLAVDRGLSPPRAYRVRARDATGRLLEELTAPQPRIGLPPDWRRHGQLRLSVRPGDAGFQGRPVVVRLQAGGAGAAGWQVVGLQR